MLSIAVTFGRSRCNVSRFRFLLFLHHLEVAADIVEKVLTHAVEIEHLVFPRGIDFAMGIPAP